MQLHPLYILAFLPCILCSRSSKFRARTSPHAQTEENIYGRDALDELAMMLDRDSDEMENVLDDISVVDPAFVCAFEAPEADVEAPDGYADAADMDELMAEIISPPKVIYGSEEAPEEEFLLAEAAIDAMSNDVYEQSDWEEPVQVAVAEAVPEYEDGLKPQVPAFEDPFDALVEIMLGHYDENTQANEELGAMDGQQDQYMEANDEVISGTSESVESSDSSSDLLDPMATADTPSWYDQYGSDQTSSSSSISSQMTPAFTSFSPETRGRSNKVPIARTKSRRHFVSPRGTGRRHEKTVKKYRQPVPTEGTARGLFNGQLTNEALIVLVFVYLATLVILKL